MSQNKQELTFDDARSILKSMCMYEEKYAEYSTEKKIKKLKQLGDNFENLTKQIEGAKYRNKEEKHHLEDLVNVMYQDVRNLINHF